MSVDPFYDKIVGIGGYDLYGALSYGNLCVPTFDPNTIVRLLALEEGVADEQDWHWILELSNGEFVYLRGGCDYTGWD